MVLLEQSRLACLAVDEAHCISEWGHDFRPEYRQVQQVRQRFSQAVCVALTATATTRVREDIRRLLGIRADGEFIASFNRPNLFLAAQPRRDGLGQTLAFLEQHRGQAGIIYCSTKKQVDQLAAELAARGWPALPYHAGLDADTRRRNQDQFIREDTAIMVATIAFGMGINKSNVRFVIHYNLPKDIESYYQEIGRSGRDGLPADCLLLHSRADAMTIRRFIDEGAASERAGRQARLDAMMRFAETDTCRRVPLLGYFGEMLSPGGTGNPPVSSDDPPLGTGAAVLATATRPSVAERSVVPVGRSPAPPGQQPRCGHCDNCRAGEHDVELTDVTEAARNFLICVQHTGECFGPTQIIDVLRGSKSQRVLGRRHDRLPVYGAGREFSAEEWRDWVRQFLDQGLVEQDLQHGGLGFTDKGRAVLSGERVFVRRRQSALEIPAIREGGPAEHDPELFEQLRRKRRELADQAGVPAYIIFSDRALVEMAAHLPRTPEQFLAINGVGEAKLANYGDVFLRLIREHCAARGLPAATEKPPVRSENTAWLTVKRRHEEVGEAFAAGQSLDQLAARYAVKRGTILQHLQRYCDAGNRLDANRVLQCSRLSLAEREPALTVFNRLGHERVGPVHEALRGSVPYEELHLLRLYLRCQEPVNQSTG
jgi:ATP-dependent DNA helicase RecQ